MNYKMRLLKNKFLILLLLVVCSSLVYGQERKYNPVFLTSSEISFSLANNKISKYNSITSAVILKKDTHPFNTANITSMQISDEALAGLLIGGGAGFAIGYVVGSLPSSKRGFVTLPPNMVGAMYAIVGGGIGYFIGKAIHKGGEK